ncbi:hypothetical protein [Devosia sp.]|uniref:hypothetical protein n=1 Tax=Devosia sp. TaxID=1871048 RepID=UPI00326368A0
MGLILPFRGYVPNKGVSYGRENTAWNKKAVAEIQRFRTELERLNAMDLGGSYRSGKPMSADDPWFEDIYFEEDIEKRTVLRDLSKRLEPGSIVVLQLSDIFQKSASDEFYGHRVYISPIDRICERYIPVISVDAGALSISIKLSKLIYKGVEKNREKIQNLIIDNYKPNLTSMESRISQLTKFETDEERSLRIDSI